MCKTIYCNLEDSNRCVSFALALSPLSRHLPLPRIPKLMNGTESLGRKQHINKKLQPFVHCSFYKTIKIPKNCSRLCPLSVSHPEVVGDVSVHGFSGTSLHLCLPLQAWKLGPGKTHQIFRLTEFHRTFRLLSGSRKTLLCCPKICCSANPLDSRRVHWMPRWLPQLETIFF